MNIMHIQNKYGGLCMIHWIFGILIAAIVIFTYWGECK